MNPKCILIVEDDKDVARLYAEAFLSDGFVVKIAYDGREGLKMALNVHPDLILLDIMLPIMQGLEVLKALKTDPLSASIPVILLTNVSDVNTINQGFHEAADGYMLKSIFTRPSQIREEVKPYLSVNT